MMMTLFLVLLIGHDGIRKTFYDGGIDEIISTRRLTHIIRAYSIFGDKAKAIQVCVNRFDEDTKQSFLELYDKFDENFEMPDQTPAEKMQEKIGQRSYFLI